MNKRQSNVKESVALLWCGIAIIVACIPTLGPEVTTYCGFIPLILLTFTVSPNAMLVILSAWLCILFYVLFSPKSHVVYTTTNYTNDNAPPPDTDQAKAHIITIAFPMFGAAMQLTAGVLMFFTVLSVWWRGGLAAENGAEQSPFQSVLLEQQLQDAAKINGQRIKLAEAVRIKDAARVAAELAFATVARATRSANVAASLASVIKRGSLKQLPKPDNNYTVQAQAPSQPQPQYAYAYSGGGSGSARC